MADTKLKDPLERSIVLHDRTWFGHILTVHPEMAEVRPLVEQAVRKPFEIRYSRSDEACRIYFGFGDQPTAIIMVVADVTLSLVKTAHFAKRVSGGAMEWSR